MSKQILSEQEQRAKVTPKKFLKRIRKIILENPDKHNPRRGDNPMDICVYQNDRGEHCLIGQYLAIYDPSGLASSVDKTTGAALLFDYLGYNLSVAGYANGVQGQADSRPDGHPSEISVPWSIVLPDVDNFLAEIDDSH